MKNFGSRTNKWKIFLQSSPVLAVLFVLVLVFAWNVFSFWRVMRATSKNKEQAEEKVLGLTEERAKLGEYINKLETEEGVEESIRDKFGFGKEGEGLIVIVEDEKKAEEDDADDGGGFWSFLKNLF